ncbi:HNH endonuclease [Geodermatophilus saharensis]|uniref:HNH endonuclease n=1 Tax=Geodermatophilus saharensis TaxID=1137994 RepID=A0A239FD88_9ACTN|nr:HNH endonuclease signature motif containing protein [Geodermatophilus saharensis]SNS54468.1 HNH endonuclease [Geodermatophilus saharensis]
MDDVRAWLFMAVDGDDRQFGGNDGYADEPDVFYSWDSRVPRAKDVVVGDRVALWDKHRLIGASVVEEIQEGEGPKTIYRCKVCGQASIKWRKVKRPFFRCGNQRCLAEFDDPQTETVPVVTYRAIYDAAWVPLPSALSAKELRDLCRDPGSQHAIRPLRWQAFEESLASKGRPLALDDVDRRAGTLSGGHRIAATRVRRGQGAFRKSLLRTYGPVCAITGDCPEEVLEAGHLYSYAEVGVHHEHGGLLLRRDIHRLFDRGALAIEPETCTISVAPDLARYPMYAALEGGELAVPPNDRHLRWFRQHWSQHRARRA